MTPMNPDPILSQNDLIALRQEIIRIQARLVIMDRELQAAGVPAEHPMVPPPITPPVEFDPDTGVMQGGRNAAYIDPVVPAGTPRTVTPSETGHTLSIARPDKGETFVGYCTRVSDQATAGTDPKAYQRVGALMLGAGHLFDRWGGFREDGFNWPFAADRFFNGAAYGDSAGDPPAVAVPTPPVEEIDIPPVALPPGEEPL